MNFQAFREHVIEPADVRILAFLNISAIGMVSVGASNVSFFENGDDRLLDAASTVFTPALRWLAPVWPPGSCPTTSART